jgi:hypothetical protein
MCECVCVCVCVCVCARARARVLLHTHSLVPRQMCHDAVHRYTAVYVFPMCVAGFMVVYLPGVLRLDGDLPRWTVLFAGHFLLFIIATGVWDDVLHRPVGALPWFVATAVGVLLWG